MRKIRDILRLRLSAWQTIPVICADTGEIRQAQFFVAVLGASNHTYADATWSQALPDWLDNHVRGFVYFGGTPEMLVPDNLKSGVSRACCYEPDLNPSYQQLAAHLMTLIYRPPFIQCTQCFGLIYAIFHFSRSLLFIRQYKAGQPVRGYCDLPRRLLSESRC
jgi:hypothetical protein